MGHRVRRWGGALLVLAGASCIAGWPLRARAEDPALTEPAFLAALEKVRGQLASGKAAEGQARLGALLELHAKQDYACAKRGDIEDLAFRLAFVKAHPPPGPKDVVRGTLISYTGAMGAKGQRLRVRYTGDRHDFEKEEDGLLLHPATFRGAFSLEVSASSYPQEAELVPLVAFGLEEDPKTGRVQVFQGICGLPRREVGLNIVWMDAALAQLDGKTSEILKQLGPPPVVAGAPYKMSLKVTETSFSVGLNGKELGSAPKPRGLFGRVGFRARGWHQAELDGVVEPSWIQGQIDEIVQRDREKFLTTFDIQKHLPAWLLEGPAAPPAVQLEASPLGPFTDAWPVELSLAHKLRAVLVLTNLALERYDAALEGVTALAGDKAAPAVCAWLMARIQLERSALTEALRSVDETLAAAPTFRPAQLLRGRVLARQGRAQEAETVLLALAQAVPDDPLMVKSVAIELLLADRQDAAHRVLEEAARRGVRSPDVDALTKALVKVKRGPEWLRSFEHKTAHYQVVSDIDKATCMQAAQVLEESLAIYSTHLQALQKAPARVFKVFLFSGQAGFQAYMEEAELFGAPGHDQVAGVYSPLLKQLLIWNLPSREDMLDTVRHEGFHQYLDQLLPDAPVWLNEGLAVYYENLSKSIGRVKHGNLHHDLLDLLRSGSLMPLAEFLVEGPRTFYAGGRQSYAQAWLLVHMLRHGTAAQRELFDALIARLATETPRAAVEAVFPAASLPDLDRALASYRTTITAPR